MRHLVAGVLHALLSLGTGVCCPDAAGVCGDVAKDWCSQVGVAAGCVSLLFTGCFLIRFACWKAAGNYDAQESIGLVFLLFYQTGISLIAI